MKRRAKVGVIEPQAQWLAGFRRFDLAHRCDFHAYDHVPEIAELATYSGFALAFCDASLELLKIFKQSEGDVGMRPTIIGLCGNGSERLAWMLAGADAAITEFAEIPRVIDMFIRSARIRCGERHVDNPFAIDAILPW